MRPVALVIVAACGSGATTATTTTTKDPITTAQLAVGCEVGVVELDRNRFVFNRDNVIILRGGVAIARATTPVLNGRGARWDVAAAIAAPDGGRWAVGIAGGALWRVTSAGEIEAIGARLGVGDARVVSVAGSATMFAIGLAGGVAFSPDGRRVQRFVGGDTRFVAVATDRIAVGHASSIEIFELAKGTRFSYTVDDVSSVAFIDAVTDRPRLVTRAGDVAYIEDAGALHRVAAPAKLRQIVVSGSRVWMLSRAELYSLEGSALVRASTVVAPDSRLFSTSTGDVWLASATVARLVRYSLDVQPDLSTWQTVVGPVFERTCSKCHLPGGEADLDLSTASSWSEQSGALRQVLHTRTMPPEGTEILETERDALLRWLTQHQPPADSAGTAKPAGSG